MVHRCPFVRSEDPGRGRVPHRIHYSRFCSIIFVAAGHYNLLLYHPLQERVQSTKGRQPHQGAQYTERLANREDHLYHNWAFCGMLGAFLRYELVVCGVSGLFKHEGFCIDGSYSKSDAL